MESKKLKASLSQWRDSLVNLSNRNKLLNYKKTRSSTIEFSELPPTEVFDRLISSKTTYVVGTKQEPTRDSNVLLPEVTGQDPLVDSDLEGFDYTKFPDSLFTKSPQREVDRILTSISRAARREYLEKGINPLYLAIGALSWIDDAKDKRISPLMLVPVELTRVGAREPMQLCRSEEDVAVNPALSLKLLEYGISLPTSEEIIGAIFEGGIDQALGLFKALKFDPAWHIADLAVLSVFAFQKEAMYKDLLDNEALVLENPVIRALGGGSRPEDSEFFFEPTTQDDIDKVAPPETTALVLDADSSQRAAISAASAGKSFVLDGPPGTGKSQTISNIIGELIHQGKSVLFVSEKIVALEVVKERLDKRGLGSFLFELHSHKSTRKEVARQLGESLRQKPVAPAGMSRADLAQARNLREKLNDYSGAANEVRMPIGLSFHEVLGKLEQLDVQIPTPAMDFPTATLSSSDYGKIVDSIQRIGRHWNLYLEGDSALWFGLADQTQLAFSIQAAADALISLEKTYVPIQKAAAALSMNGTLQGEYLQEILELWASGEVLVDEKWLTCESLDAQNEALQDALLAAKSLSGSAEKCAEAFGESWTTIAGFIDDESSLSLPAMDRLNPEWTAMILGEVSEFQHLSIQLQESAGLVTERIPLFGSQFGITVPANLKETEDFIEALTILEASPLPPTSWLSGAKKVQSVREACVLLQPLNASASTARNNAESFGEGVLDLALRDITEFFRGNSGFFSRFSSSYKLRKKQLLAQSLSTSWKQTLSALPSALAWQSAQTNLKTAEIGHSSLLGQAYKASETDWEGLYKSVELAERIVAGFEVLDEVKFEASIDSRLSSSELQNQISDLTDFVALFKSFYKYEGALPATNQTLKALVQLRGEIVQATSELNKFANLVVSIQSPFTDKMPVRALFEGFVKVQAHKALKIQIEQNLPRYALAFGESLTVDELLDGLVLDRLTKKLNWSAAIRESVQKGKNGPNLREPLTQSEYTALTSMKMPSSLKDSTLAWTSAWKALKQHFTSETHGRLEQLVSVFASGKKLLEDFSRAVPDTAAWFDLNQSVEILKEFGLNSALSNARDKGLDGELSQKFVLKTVLAQWVELMLSKDSRLVDDPTFGRAQLIETYRELDSKLKDNAVSEIIKSGSSRRPRSGHGQAGLIEREAEKKTRHIPVRDLIDRSRDVVQALHPCFMMSPLAVSQYLPNDMRFDVVVFDEASQVTPGDAINCVYRGQALIAAGDQKQLPPMSFFSASGFEDESFDEDMAGDFDSVLDLMKASGSFNSLTLNWHYRSRHEHLIAYSNMAFYGSRLITFPGATAVSDDLGVKLLKVEGLYRRAGGADNPIEAREVAARVLHHFDSRPGQSLGVVAFSTAQRDAIENAVTRARKDRPDLDNHFEGTRQDGFFINSLEAVQGDERDVIIFSIGYGPDEAGKIYKNFGPLNREGGERRLNVAITRARKLVEIVASMGASDLGEVKSEGARHLRKYLDFAERGPVALQLELGGDELGTDSPFEDSVIEAIRSWGYDVQPQVGVAGFRIDIGVKHPNNPGAFILGIECDGAMYHSSKTARDRDRLRHEILEGLGWSIHHIWGTAWYRHRSRELSKLKEIIDAQATKPISGRLVSNSFQKSPTPLEISFEQNLSSDFSQWTADYSITKPVKLPTGLDLSDLGSAYKLIDFVKAVVAREQPIHRKLLITRLRSSAKIGKAGSRVLATIDHALKLAKVQVHGDFIWTGKSREVKVRRPSPEEVRDITLIAPEELREAIMGVVKHATGISSSDLSSAVREIFGWKRAGTLINVQIGMEVKQLLESGKLIESGGGIRLALRG